MLLALVLIPILAALAILGGAKPRQAALAAALVNAALGVAAALQPKAGFWNFSLNVLEKPEITLSLGLLDGMSVVMLLLSVIVTLAAILSGKAPEGREKLYYSSSLLISAGAIGAFVATDLFFFYAFHELALIPTFLMIGMLGRGTDRRATAWKITIYLGFGSLVLLAGLVWLASATGSYSIPEMIENAKASPIDPAAQKSIAAFLIVGFGILVSLFPFHSWAAPAYASAPAPTAMLHAGVLKKFGLYGLLRLALPIVPDGMQAWLTPLCVLLLGNILWVGLVTIWQKRLDTLLGNSSVMHMGYIFLAIAALAASPSNSLAQPAAVLLMFAHGISIAMAFGLADRIERSTGTLDLDQLGGLAKAAPKLAFLFGLVTMASIGLPGLANFAGEVMVFISSFAPGSYDAAKGLGPVQITCILAIWGVVISAVYGLRAFRKIFQGPSNTRTEAVADLTLCDRAPAILLAIVLLAVGIFPKLLLSLL